MDTSERTIIVDAPVMKALRTAWGSCRHRRAAVRAFIASLHQPCFDSYGVDTTPSFARDATIRSVSFLIPGLFTASVTATKCGNGYVKFARIEQTGESDDDPWNPGGGCALSSEVQKLFLDAKSQEYISAREGGDEARIFFDTCFGFSPATWPRELVRSGPKACQKFYDCKLKEELMIRKNWAELIKPTRIEVKAPNSPGRPIITGADQMDKGSMATMAAVYRLAMLSQIRCYSAERAKFHSTIDAYTQASSMTFASFLTERITERMMTVEGLHYFRSTLRDSLVYDFDNQGGLVPCGILFLGLSPPPTGEMDHNPFSRVRTTDAIYLSYLLFMERSVQTVCFETERTQEMLPTWTARYIVAAQHPNLFNPKQRQGVLVQGCLARLALVGLSAGLFADDICAAHRVWLVQGSYSFKCGSQLRGLTFIATDRHLGETNLQVGAVQEPAHSMAEDFFTQDVIRLSNPTVRGAPGGRGIASSKLQAVNKMQSLISFVFAILPGKSLTQYIWLPDENMETRGNTYGLTKRTPKGTAATVAHLERQMELACRAASNQCRKETWAGISSHGSNPYLYSINLPFGAGSKKQEMTDA